MKNKLKNNKFRYLLIRIIFTLFEELYKTTSAAVFFLIFKTSFQSRNYYLINIYIVYGNRTFLLMICILICILSSVKCSELGQILHPPETFL